MLAGILIIKQSPISRAMLGEHFVVCVPLGHATSFV